MFTRDYITLPDSHPFFVLYVDLNIDNDMQVNKFLFKPFSISGICRWFILCVGSYIYVGIVDGIIYKFTFNLMKHFLLWPLYLERGKSENDTISGY